MNRFQLVRGDDLGVVEPHRWLLPRHLLGQAWPAVGASTTLSVQATGQGPLTYQWRKDGTNVAGANGATLNFASAAASDAGSYSVVVTNAYGTVTSSAAVSLAGSAGK